MGEEREVGKDLLDKGISAAGYTVVFRVLSQFVSLAVIVLVVRGLSENDYGVYSLFYSFVGIIATIASFGIANTLQRYVPEYYTRGEFKIAHNLFRLATIIRLLSNTVIIGLVLILWEQVAPHLKIAEYKSYFMLFSLVILLQMQKGLLEICLGAYFLQKYSQALAFAFAGIRFLGYTAAILLGMNLWVVLSVDLCANVLVFLALQLVYYTKIPHSGGSDGKIPRDQKSRIMRYALFYNFNDAGVALLKPDMDSVVIAFFLSPVHVGAYALFQRLSKLIGKLLPVKYLIDVVRPTFFSASIDGDTRRINQIYQVLVKLEYLFNVPIFFFLAAFGQAVIDMIGGGKFGGYSAVLTGIYFFRVLVGFELPLSLVAQLKERADVILYSKIFAVYNLLAAVVLVKFFGIWGAVVATGTALFWKNLFIWYFLRKEASFNGMGGFFVRILSYWLGVGVVSLAVNHFIANQYLGLAVGCLLFVACLLGQFRMRLFNAEERAFFLVLPDRNRHMRPLVKILGVGNSGQTCASGVSERV